MSVYKLEKIGIQFYIRNFASELTTLGQYTFSLAFLPVHHQDQMSLGTYQASRFQLLLV